MLIAGEIELGTDAQLSIVGGISEGKADISVNPKRTLLYAGESITGNFENRSDFFILYKGVSTV